MTTVCSHQPSLFPWIGYWNKVAVCDKLIMTCAVKMDYGGFQNRVGLNDTWLTVPVAAGSKHALLLDVRIVPGCLDKVFKTILNTLGGKKWPHADVVGDIVEQTRRGLGGSDYLVDLNISAFHAVNKALGARCVAVFDETMPRNDMSKTARLAERVKRLTPEATRYMGGGGMAAYIKSGQWPTNIEVFVQHPKVPLDKGTILQLIAQVDAPLEVVRDAFSWEPLDGHEDVGDSAALG